jgi:hypothetical protein
MGEADELASSFRRLAQGAGAATGTGTGTGTSQGNLASMLAFRNLHVATRGAHCRPPGPPLASLCSRGRSQAYLPGRYE